MTTKPKKFKKVVEYDKFSSEDKFYLLGMSLIITYIAGIYIISYGCSNSFSSIAYALLPFIMYCVVGGIYKILSRKVYWVEVKK